MAFETNGAKWFGTDSGLVMISGLKWTFYYTNNSGLPSNSIGNILLDKTGAKWIGTVSGLALFDNTNWSVFNTGNSKLPDNFVHQVIEDNNGNMWIGTDNGLAVYKQGGVSGVVDPDAPPQPPLNLSAKSSDTNITLTWNYNLDSNVFFRVYRSKEQGKNYVILEDSVEEKVYYDYNVSQDTTYYYIVTAFNDMNKKESIISNEASGRLSPVSPPAPPDNISLITGTDNFTLSWNYKPDSSIIFRIYRSTQSGTNYNLLKDNVTVLQYVDKNPNQDTTYFYVVRANNTVTGKECNNSNEVSGKLSKSNVVENNYNSTFNTKVIYENYSIILRTVCPLKDCGTLNFRIFNQIGEVTPTLYSNSINESSESIHVIDESSFSEGIYFFIITSGNQVSQRKFVIIK